MGKFQLDYKGQAQVERYHEKNSKGSQTSRKARVQALLKQAQKVKKKRNRWLKSWVRPALYY